MSETTTVAAPHTIKLDIACGARKADGFTGIDIVKVAGVDIKHNLLRFPWPIESNSVSEARCSHFVEHIPHQEFPGFAPDREVLAPMRWVESYNRWGFIRDTWFDFWEECHRVLVPNGEITVTTPYYSSRRADQDPTHERRIVEESYFYLDQRWLEANACAYPFAASFEITKLNFLIHDDPKPGRDRDHDLNVVADIEICLKAIKPSKCWWEK
jgi:SAM-dependent methyltransferase